MKRGAEEYITKENGSTINPGIISTDKAKMSTAAQQARRKIATPKSRLGRSTTPTSVPNPFAAQQQQSTPSTGFFGGQTGSASFPPAAQSQQSFEFSMPSTSSSFTFGSNNNNSFSNPFANMNGSAIAQNNTVDNADVMQESPQKKPAPAFSFGGTSAASAPTTNGFGFQFGGQPAKQEQGTNTSLFGSQQQVNGGGQSSAPSLFGSTTTSNAPTFGGFSNNAPATTTPPLFGQSSSTPSFSSFAASAPAPAATFKFGETTVVNDDQKENQQPAQKPLFSFTSTQSTVPATEPKKFSFGQPAGQATPSKSLFGQQPEPASEPPKQSTFSIPPTTSATTANIFGALAKPDTSNIDLFSRASPAADVQSTTSDAGRSDTTPQPAEEPEKPTNPFASLFAGKSASDNVSHAPVAKPKFTFGEQTSYSAPSKPAEAAKPADPFTFKPASPTTQSTDAAGSSFSTKSFTQPASKPSIFNFPPASTSSTIETPTKPERTSMFGQQSSGLTTNAGSTPFKAFGSQGDSNKRNDETSEDEPAKKRLFTGTSTPQAMAKSAGVSRPAAEPTFKPLPASAAKPQEEPLEAINRPVFSEGPPQVPRYLDANKYKSYDLMWRLKALNRRFQAVVASRDTDQHDLLSLVQNYLDHREALGAGGLSSYQRPKAGAAGAKRKAADVDDMQDDEEQNKKSKAASASNVFGQQSSSKPTTTSSNLFGAVKSPKPASSSPVKPSDSTTSNLFKSMIPGAGQTTVGALQVTPTNMNKSTTPPSSPPKAAPKFEVPKFGNVNGSFASAFAQSAAANQKKAEEAEKAKRKAEEFDSEDDDEAEWNKKYEEEQRAKKAKIEAAMKTNLFVPSASSSRSNSPFNFSQPVQSIEKDTHTTGNAQSNAINIASDEETSQNTGSGTSGDEEAEAEAEAARDSDDDGDDEEEEVDEEGLPIPEIAPENSLFSRISKDASKPTENPILQPAANNSFKPGIMFGNIGKSTPDAPSFTPVTPAVIKGDFVPTKTFNFTPTPASSTPALGTVRDGPIPGEGLFGSRPSTPQPSTETKANPFAGVFGSAKTPSGIDNTWTKGSPIRFNGEKSDNDTPTVEVTAATPPAKETPKPFAGLFGEATSASAKNPVISNGTFTGFNFGQKPSASSSTTAPGFLSAASHLGGASAESSRANSPGLLSEAESVATDNTEDYSNDPQTSLMNTPAGEEDEDVLLESRAVLDRNYKEGEVPEKSKITKGWNKIGSGVFKILKHRDTGKTRIVFRVEPGANVLLNARLIPGAKYVVTKGAKVGQVSIPVSTDKGLQMYAVRVKDVAERIGQLLEENKKN